MICIQVCKSYSPHAHMHASSARHMPALAVLNIPMSVQNKSSLEDSSLGYVACTTEAATKS